MRAWVNSSISWQVVLLAVIGFLTMLPVSAAGIRLEILERAPINSQGPIAYELLSGNIHGEIDPKDPRNAVVNDIALAPRNAEGLVEYSATFALSKPVDMSNASGVLLYDVPNRGSGEATADPEGHMHLISGWQGDLPAALGKQTISVPAARAVDGSSITGPILVRFMDVPTGTPSVAITVGAGQGVPRPEPVTLDNTIAKLLRRSSDSDPGIVMPESAWAFADCRQAPFPGTPDPHWLCLRDGFESQYAYELSYEGKDPLVLGLGFAAVRDLVDFLRRAPGSNAAPNPIAHQVRHAIVAGMSQSGNFVRSFIHLGFNEGSDGSRVFDGAFPYIAGRQVPLNFRFANPGGAAGLYEPGSEAVLWWGRYRDRTRGRPVNSLLDRCRASHTCPKIVEAFGSAELWGLRMSPDLVGTDARSDIPLPPEVRRYYLPGVTHGGGQGGFEGNPGRLQTAMGCVLPANPNPSFQTQRALMHVLVQWVTSGKLPPPSVYPKLSSGELVPISEYVRAFPKGPGLPTPEGKLNPLLVYDFGKGFNADDLSGTLTRLPPTILRTLESRVVRVDTDGNEIGGVPSAQHQVPLGTYLGWNERASGFYKGRGCDFQGGYVPFAQTRAERIAAGDPRPSLAERYGTHEGYVRRVRAAVRDLVEWRFLLAVDAMAIVQQAEASDVLSDASPKGAAALGDYVRRRSKLRVTVREDCKLKKRQKPEQAAAAERPLATAQSCGFASDGVL